MSQDIKLKEIERKAWTSYFHDGLWDIFFGLLMLTMGIRSLTDNVWVTLVILAAVLVVLLGKKFITIPRIGLVKFSPAREAKQRKLIIMLSISIIMMLILLVLALLGQDLLTKGIRAAIQGVGFALIFSLVAYFMDFKRLYAYGLLFTTGTVLWELLGEPIGPIAFSVSGVIALVIGLVVLTRFLRKYPKPPEEMTGSHD